MDKIQTARYQLVLNERVRDEFKLNRYFVKVQAHPLKVYTFCLTTNVGAEALYIEGSNNNEAIVNPNRFPWFNLNLGPQNMLIRKGHLFAIDQSGFDYINKTLQHYYNVDRNKFLSSLKLLSDTILEGQLCSRIMVDFPDFKWNTYTVKKGETFTSIATKYVLNDYIIMERNGKTSFSDVHEGDKILIPSMFVKKIILSIQKDNFLPIQQILFDDKGLLAVVEFKNLVVNQPIPSVEFTTGYKDYGF